MKPGYKQTEVGVIPEEWEAKAIGGEIDLLTGFPFPSSGYSKSGVRLLRGSNIKRGETDWSDEITQYWPAITRDLSRYSMQKGDLVISMDGSLVGRSYAQLEEGDLPALLLQRVARIRATKLDVTYLRQFVGSDQFIKYVDSVKTVTAIPHISPGDIRKFAIPVPTTVTEQRAIATALSDVDGLLGGLDRLIAKKRDLKQAAMQQLLTGQTRLPGFAPEKASFRQSEVGEIPDDWKLTRLVKLVDPSRGIRYGIVQPGNYDPQGRYMIRGQDYSEVKGWANPTDVFRVSPGIEERYRNSRVKTGDLIMTIVGYCGHVEMTPEWLNGANLTQTTARIAIQPDKAVSAFCKYMLVSPTGRNQVNAYMKGAAQPGLNCGDVEKFLIPIPPLLEQTAIAEGLTEMDAELAGLEQRQEKTRALKQAMMQELLTGRTRLLSPEVAHA